MTLRATQKSLAEERQKLVGGTTTLPSPATPPPTRAPVVPGGTATPTPTPTPVPQATAPTPTPTPVPVAPSAPEAVVVNEIDETQNRIEEQIREIEQLTSTRSLPEQSQGVGVPGGGQDNRPENRGNRNRN